MSGSNEDKNGLGLPVLFDVTYYEADWLPCRKEQFASTMLGYASERLVLKEGKEHARYTLRRNEHDKPVRVDSTVIAQIAAIVKVFPDKRSNTWMEITIAKCTINAAQMDEFLVSGRKRDETLVLNPPSFGRNGNDDDDSTSFTVILRKDNSLSEVWMEMTLAQLEQKVNRVHSINQFEYTAFDKGTWGQWIPSRDRAAPL